LQKRKPGISYTINTHIRRKDSSIFLAESRQSCFCENGRKLFINLVRDISDREKDQQDLLRMQTRIQFATRAANIGIWECNFSTKKLDWDDRMLELHGITDKKTFLTSDDWYAMVHPDDRLRCRKIIKQILKTKIPVDFDYRIVLPDSSIRVIRSFGQFITDTGNKLTE
jgi:PAS domain-containing protein